MNEILELLHRCVCLGKAIYLFERTEFSFTQDKTQWKLVMLHFSTENFVNCTYL